MVSGVMDDNPSIRGANGSNQTNGIVANPF